MNIRSIKYIQPRYQRRLLGRKGVPSMCACAKYGVENCTDKKFIINEPVILVRISFLTTSEGVVWYKNIRFRPECFELFMSKCAEDTSRELNEWHESHPVEMIYPKQSINYGTLDEQQTKALRSWKGQVAGYRNRLNKYVTNPNKTSRTFAAIDNVQKHILRLLRDINDLEKIAHGREL